MDHVHRYQKSDERMGFYLSMAFVSVVAVAVVVVAVVLVSVTVLGIGAEIVIENMNDEEAQAAVINSPESKVLPSVDALLIMWMNRDELL
jgi:hypothetical protein